GAQREQFPRRNLITVRPPEARMDELPDQIARSAEKAVAMCEARGGGELDYSEVSLAVVEDTLAEANQWVSEMTPAQVTTLVQDFGCYILEVGRREFGGRYQWH